MAEILLVEDHALLRDVLRRSLERHGHSVIEASNGKEAISAFLQRKPDLVIMDIVLPGKNGEETILDLKCRDPLVKIIAMTGRITPNRSLPIGVTGTLAKPFSDDEFSFAVEAALREDKAPH